MFVIIIFYDDCSDDHDIVVLLVCLLSLVYLTGKAVIRNLIYKFITRLNESTNDVILAILSSDIRWTSRISHYLLNTLYVHHDLV